MLLASEDPLTCICHRLFAITLGTRECDSKSTTEDSTYSGYRTQRNQADIVRHYPYWIGFIVLEGTMIAVGGQK